MKLSREKVSHLSHLLINHIMEDSNFDIFAEENDVRLEMLKVINQELEIGEEIDRKVRKKMDGYSRKIIEGTGEWEIIYKKMYDEELEKMGRL